MVKMISRIRIFFWRFKFGDDDNEICPVCNNKLTPHFGDSCYVYSCPKVDCDFNVVIKC